VYVKDTSYQRLNAVLYVKDNLVSTFPRRKVLVIAFMD